MIIKTGNFSLFIFLLTLFSFTKNLLCIDSLSLSIQNRRGQKQNSIAVGTPFYLTLTITGDYTGNVPTIKGVESGSLLSTHRSSSFQFDGTKATRETVYNYLMRIDTVGVYDFGPLTIEYEGAQYQSPKVSLEIVRDQVKVQETSTRTKSSPELFLTLETDKKEYFIAEEFSVTLSVYNSLENVQMHQPVKLNLENALASEWQESERKEKIIAGQPYEVISFKAQIKAHKIGNLLIPAVSIRYVKPGEPAQANHAAFGIFASLLQAPPEERTITTEPLTVIIHALPKTSLSVSAVGSFSSVRFAVDKKDIRQGDACIATLTITGKDAPSDSYTPELVLPEGLTYYASRNRVVEAGREFEFIIQGNKPGTYVISDQVFTFFNPELKQYRTLRAPGEKIRVTPHAFSQPEKNITKNITPTTENTAENAQEPLVIESGKYSLYDYVFACLFLLFIILLVIISKRPIKNILCYVQKKRAQRNALKTAYARLSAQEITKKQDILSVFTQLFAEKLESVPQHLSHEEQTLWHKFLEQLYEQRFGNNEIKKSHESQQLLMKEARMWLMRLEKILQ